MKKKSIFFLLVLCFCSCKRNYNSAKNLFEKKEYKLAIERLKPELVPPSDVNSLKLAGMCYYQLDSFGTALGFFNKVLQKERDSSILSKKAICLVKLNMLNEALEAYNRLLIQDSSRIYFYEERVKLFRDLGYYDEALNDYDKIIKLDPFNAEAYNSKGVLCVQIKKYNIGLACYEKSISINNFNSGVYYNKGVVLVYLQRLDEALASFSSAIQLDPKGLYYHNRGIVHYLQKKYNPACEDWQIAKKLGYENAEAYLKEKGCLSSN